MLKIIANILKNQCKVSPGEMLLVGVSGGPDSLCLLYVLHQIGVPVLAMHVNHQLRPEANDEVNQVWRLCEDLGVKLITSEVDVASYSQENSYSIEEAARNLRYGLLFEHARRNDAKAVVVGHNADDQVETILMHLLRGSGLNGLRGMEFRSIPNPWSMEIPLLRPFLSTWRADIQKYLDDQGLQPITDLSNKDITFFRNRLRYELLPVLESYNPSIRETFLRMAQSIKDDSSVLEKLTDEAWSNTLIRQGDGYISFKTNKFLELPVSIQRYVLRRGVTYHLPGLRDVDFICIERGIMTLSGENRYSQTDLIGGLRLIKEGECFWVSTWQADLPVDDFPRVLSSDDQELTIPSINALANGWQLEVALVNPSDLAIYQDRANQDSFQALMDIDKLNLPLVARGRKSGDQIQPTGLNGHSIKLTDLMINLKLPKRVRALWPVICSKGEIVWVPGYRINHQVGISSSTETAVYLRLLRIISS